MSERAAGKASLSKVENAHVRSLVERYREATWVDAEIAAVAGVKQSTISRLRSGSVGASLHIARRLCSAAGVDLLALLDDGAFVPLAPVGDLVADATRVGAYSREVCEAVGRMIRAAPLARATTEDVAELAAFVARRWAPPEPWRAPPPPRAVARRLAVVEAEQAKPTARAQGAARARRE